MDTRTDGKTDKQTDGTDENYIPLRHTPYTWGIMRSQLRISHFCQPKSTDISFLISIHNICFHGDDDGFMFYVPFNIIKVILRILRQWKDDKERLLAMKSHIVRS